MRKFLALILVIAALLVPSCSLAVNLPEKDIIIVYTNDVHCGVDDFVGYAGLAQYRKQMQALSPYVTLVDAGDAVQGATIGAISQGRYIIEIMNYLGYDVAVPGNHEFDYGWSQFENFVKNLSCGYVSCNLVDAVTGQLFLKPYKIIKYGNTKVAYVGICTPATITSSTPSSFMDSSGNYIYDFCGDLTGEKLCEAVQKAVNKARDEGADFVIAVAHLGEYKDVQEEWSALRVIAGTRGIDALIDGHSHEVTECLKVKNLDGQEIVITQTGTKLHNIGNMVIDTKGEISSKLIAKVDSEDPDTEKFINDIKARYEDTLGSKIGHTNFMLRAMDDEGNWLIRNGETGICDLVTDSLLHSAKSTKTGKADVAVYNAGGIRTNVNPGELTYGDALSVLPFSNTVCICEVSGQTLLDELEHGARLFPEKSGGLLHVSGLTYTINGKIPSPVKINERGMFESIQGERRVSDVKVNGEALDLEKLYKVIGTSYTLLARGDGHMFKGAKIIEADYEVACDSLVHYIKSLGELPERYKDSQNRINFVK
ncbi:MAG: bifunctional metallophosphatase/5'-nucleotidase [Synergistaceae bacterium]|nr:bifunctional metallophosphatase/5'-nucleotidase [Synergistaceae bacterium]